MATTHQTPESPPRGREIRPGQCDGSTEVRGGSAYPTTSKFRVSKFQPDAVFIRGYQMGHQSRNRSSFRSTWTRSLSRSSSGQASLDKVFRSKDDDNTTGTCNIPHWP